MDAISSMKNGLSGQLAAPKSRTAGADSLAESKTLPAIDKDFGSDNSVAQDSVTISQESMDSLKLTSTSTVQGTSNQAQIPDRQKAQDIVGQIVTMVSNQPAKALEAFSNVAAPKVARAIG